MYWFEHPDATGARRMANTGLLHLEAPTLAGARCARSPKPRMRLRDRKASFPPTSLYARAGVLQSCGANLAPEGAIAKLA